MLYAVQSVVTGHVGDGVGSSVVGDGVGWGVGSGVGSSVVGDGVG